MLPLFLLSAGLESLTQIFLKKGAVQNQDQLGVRYLLQVLRSRWVWLGILAFAVESLVWLGILAYLPLSLAFPTSGLQKFVMVAVAVLVFGEKISDRERKGLALISLGLICIAASAGQSHG